MRNSLNHLLQFTASKASKVLKNDSFQMHSEGAVDGVEEIEGRLSPLISERGDVGILYNEGKVIRQFSGARAEIHTVSMRNT